MQKALPNLTETQAAILQHYLTHHEGDMGTVLFELGSVNRDLYLLQEGACEVYQKFVLGHKLFALRVGILLAPVLLGEANLLLGEKRNATIIVSTKKLSYSRLSYESFEKLKKEQPELAISLLEEIGKLVSRRFLNTQHGLIEKFLAEQPRPFMGLKFMKKFMGQAHLCSPELAMKLFNIKQPIIKLPGDDEK